MKIVQHLIANTKYEHYPLKTSIKEAKKMRTFLQKHNFTVTYKENLNKRQLKRVLKKYEITKSRHAVSLFCYYGHIYHFENNNYIVPVGAEIEYDEELLDSATNLDEIVAIMENKNNRLNIIVLDSIFSKGIKK